MLTHCLPGWSSSGSWYLCVSGFAIVVRATGDDGHFLEVFERYRRRHHPLERLRAPWIGYRLLTRDPGRDHVVEEDDDRSRQKVREDAGDEIGARENRRVVGDTARHPLEASIEHGEEGDIEANLRAPEVNLAQL